MPERVEDHFKLGQAFEDLLTEANDNATKPRDVEFVESLQAKWKDFGMMMYLSEAQLNWLQRIADEG